MKHVLNAAVVGAVVLAATAFAQGAGNKQGTPPMASPKGPPPAPQLAPVVKGKGPEKGKKYPKKMIERGALLVAFGDCNTCHTPWAFNPELGAPAPDMTRMLSGHPHDAPDPKGELGPGDNAVIGPTFTSFKLPFGVVYTQNLTPDMETGTGAWTEEMFVKIFRTGKHLGGEGRPVLPPMPWHAVGALSDQDLKSIFAYLRSIPPIQNAVPAPKVPEPVMKAIGETNQKILKMSKGKH